MNFLTFVARHVINVSHCPAAQANHGMLEAGQSAYMGISSLC